MSQHWTGVVADGNMGFTIFPGMMKGTFNGVPSLVGKEVEGEIRANPNRTVRQYFLVCRRMVKTQGPGCAL